MTDLSALSLDEGAFARDANGTDVASRSPAAVCWCALGAMTAAGIDYGVDPEGQAAWLALRTHIGRHSISYWNDDVAAGASEVAATLRVVAEQFA